MPYTISRYYPGSFATGVHTPHPRDMFKRDFAGHLSLWHDQGDFSSRQPASYRRRHGSFAHSVWLIRRHRNRHVIPAPILPRHRT